MVVQWPFGHGLSYTSYEYSDITVDKTEFKAADVLTVTVNVKNTGKVAGKESVLLFSSDHFASCVPDNRRLRDFTKVSLAPGESATVTFELPATDLAFADSKGQWTLEEGDFTLSVGGQNVNVRCTETILWDQPNID
jgi:beta-glucosidase